MKTVKARAKEWAHVLISTNSRPATSELLTQIAEMSYVQGAIEQDALDGKQLIGCVLEERDAVIDIALTAYCKTECPNFRKMCDGTCESYERFKELLNNNGNESN